MSHKYNQFIFENYAFDKSTKIVSLKYSFDSELTFTEEFKFDFDFIDYNEKALDRALQLLFFVAGVSYYKAYLAPEVVVKQGQIDEQTAGFLSRTYQKGLGEFFYVNKLDPNTKIKFPVNTKPNTSAAFEQPGSGMLIGIGGGKDSLVSVELLRDTGLDLATWSLNHRPQLTPLTERIGLKHYFVERQWDTKLLDLNSKDALNGHIPISAIIACVGTVVAILTGRKDSVVSNEQSSNEPTLFINDTPINHQYSKSQEFEKDYQTQLKHDFGSNIRYYSFLRPLSEVFIAELFSILGFKKYRDVFSSCNRAFVHSSSQIFWDGTCSKCAFFFLAMTPFTIREDLEELFNGKNLLLDPGLEKTYRQLLGIDGDKPLDCVGEVEECRQAMYLSQQTYPTLSRKYSYEMSEDYDYQALRGHEMPDEIYKHLLDGIKQTGFGPRVEQI